jgi:hypothetical protein
VARSTKAEVARRVADLFPLVCDCFSLREIRSLIDAKTSWGPTISDSTLKYYISICHRQLREAAHFDRSEEIGSAKRRLERIIARASAKGELQVQLSAQKQLSELLGLPAPTRSEVTHSGEISVEEKRSQLVEKILAEVAAKKGESDEPQG